MKKKKNYSSVQKAITTHNPFLPPQEPREGREIKQNPKRERRNGTLSPPLLSHALSSVTQPQGILGKQASISGMSEKSKMIQRLIVTLSKTQLHLPSLLTLDSNSTLEPTGVKSTSRKSQALAGLLNGAGAELQVWIPG